ncbi:hypothetical protein JW964_25405 [candidate division KSB1 bacterium]|nr:hypothetical protein [candidate division KSB1 bacterium]
MNLTLFIDDDLLKKARKVALKKNTTVSALIQNFLMELIAKEKHQKEQTAAELESLFDSSIAQAGTKNWSRDELYER